MDYYVVTDTHLDHTKMVEVGIRHKGYEKDLIEGLKDIPYGSTLIHLGDVGYKGDNLNDYFWTLKNRGIHVIVIEGNHDPKSSVITKVLGVVSGNGFYLEFGGFKFMFSHKPMVVPLDWVNIHGHHHEGTHRDEEYKELIKEVSGQHVLLSVEHHGYRPHKLMSIVKDLQRGKRRTFFDTIDYMGVKDE